MISLIAKNFTQLKVLELVMENVKFVKYLNYKDLQDLRHLKELHMTVVTNYLSSFKQIIEGKFHSLQKLIVKLKATIITTKIPSESEKTFE